MTVAYIRARNSKPYRPDTKGAPVESRHDLAYTDPAKSKSFRLTQIEHFGPLHPLALGNPVILVMDRGAVKTAKKTTEPPKPTPVVIVPGPMIGARKDQFLVSVIGKGSTIATVGRRTAVGNLVLAGIPSVLAEALMDKFRRILNWSN